jgi:hypothetical protein
MACKKHGLSSLPEHPAARAPAVLAHGPALERELSDLKQQVAERALAAYEGNADAREKLAALVANIRTIEFQIECNGQAHKLAQDLDRAARTDWRRQIEAESALATAGVTRKKCCTLCSEAKGCIITGDACAHPVLVGGVGPRYQSNEPVRDLYRAAARHCKLPGYWQPGEDDELEDEAAA